MMKKRTIAAALSLLLCCFGANALAKTETKYGLTISSENGGWIFSEEPVVIAEDEDLDMTSIQTLTIVKPGNYTLSGSGKRVVVNNVKGAVNLTLNGLTLENTSGTAMRINNSAKTTLLLKGKNEMTGGSLYDAVLDNGTNPMEITCTNRTAENHVCGELEVSINRSSSYSAAIGSSSGNPAGNITISCGKITANTKSNGAAIGSGMHGDCSNITISGGTVVAANSGTAIGSGQRGHVDGITISGGTVTATSSASTAIGSCSSDIIAESFEYGSAKNITISGGNVTAISGGDSAGIGAGGYCSASDIIISGGNIHIQSNGGAGIGCGGNNSIEYQTVASNITISGGKIDIEINHGAGIGSGTLSFAQNINISGGDITVTPNSSGGGGGAGIGSGWHGRVDGITITGGNFNLQTAYGAGIGGGLYGNAKNITISGGNIHSESLYGVGIGGGGNSYSGTENILISGGSITAIGGGSSSGIGCGMYSHVSNLLITGGNIEAKGGVSESTNGAYIASGIGAGYNGTAENIVIAPSSHRIEASVSNSGFDNMTELEGSPFTSGKTDVTEQVSGFQYFKTIGEYVGSIDMPATGDNTSFTLWASLLALSGMLFGVLKRRAA